MSLELEIIRVNDSIVHKLNEASKLIVVQAYEPLFDKVKAIALAHMKQLGTPEINFKSLAFRSDGNFYSYSMYADSGTRPLSLESLPIYFNSNYFNSNQKPMVQEGFTKYQSEMEFVLQEFRNAVKTSLAQLVSVSKK